MGDVGPWVNPGEMHSIDASIEHPGDVGPPTGPAFVSVGKAAAVGAAVGAAIGGAVGAIMGMATGESSGGSEESSWEPPLAGDSDLDSDREVLPDSVGGDGRQVEFGGKGEAGAVPKG